MSTWSEYKRKKVYKSLNKDIKADVVIIGGGITGILNAYRLCNMGISVVLIDKAEIGSHATIATTAFITKVIDTELAEIVSIFNRNTAKNILESGQWAVDEFEKLIKNEKIECEFTRCTDYIFAGSKKHLKTLIKEFKTYKSLNIPSSLHAKSNDLGFENHGYIEVPMQAKFHVTKFLYQLADIIDRRGCRIYEYTQADKIEGQSPILIHTKKGKITAKNVIIATHRPIINEKTRFKKGMYLTYLLEIQLPSKSFREAIYEDLDNPYHYFRIDRFEKHDRMIIGNEDHKDILNHKPYKKSFISLEEYAQKIIQNIPYKIVRKWHGPILESSDGLPLIGEIKLGYLVATAFSGNGMTYSMISSKILGDIITKKQKSLGIDF